MPGPPRIEFAGAIYHLIYPLYLAPARRPTWLRVDRLLGEHGIGEDSAEGRIEFQRRMEQRRSEGEAPKPVWRRSLTI